MHVSAGRALSVYLQDLTQRSRIPLLFVTPRLVLTHPRCLDVYLIAFLKISSQTTNLPVLGWVKGRLVIQGVEVLLCLQGQHLLHLGHSLLQLSFFDTIG